MKVGTNYHLHRNFEVKPSLKEVLQLPKLSKTRSRVTSTTLHVTVRLTIKKRTPDEKETTYEIHKSGFVNIKLLILPKFQRSP